MKNTLIVNLYAGPGTGKSTTAAYIFSQLKMKGIDAELVTEYAKDKTWEGCDSAFKCQLYINAKQAYRISRVYGKVDVIITDSPLLLGVVYSEEDHVINAAIGEDAKYKYRIDYFLERDGLHKYNPNGRNQTINEALELDQRIQSVLIDSKLPYKTVYTYKEHLDNVVDEIIKKLKENE